ncbi:hypothetical protein [Priestia abyssalis]|uniref:hypothetical protein n=1 Tax=Priestia abyssalis TaxID=1221450 RepID=UPI000994DD71|nr:hypothetical protein [Priestia abyssalis]
MGTQVFKMETAMLALNLVNGLIFAVILSCTKAPLGKGCFSFAQKRELPDIYLHIYACPKKEDD